MRKKGKGPRPSRNWGAKERKEWANFNPSAGGRKRKEGGGSVDASFGGTGRRGIKGEKSMTY